MAIENEMGALFPEDVEGSPLALRRGNRDLPQYIRQPTKEEVQQNKELLTDFIPGVSEYKDLESIRTELKKDNPGYKNIALDTAGLLLGVVPGVGDVARKGLKNFVKKDVEKVIQFRNDPNAIEEWKKINQVNQKQSPVPEVKKAADDLYLGKITSQEFRNTVKNFQPIQLIDETNFPKFIEKVDIVGALDKNKRDKILDVDVDIPDGTRVGSRLDIPAYENFDTWVVSIHKENKGDALAYGQVAILKDVNFTSSATTAQNIARQKKVKDKASESGFRNTGKSTIGRIEGDFYNSNPTETWTKALDIIKNKDPEWTQVGMNPYRQSQFYNKKTGMPVFEAEEVIQVGPLVLAKNVKQPTREQLKKLRVRVGGKDPETGLDTKENKGFRFFNQGGYPKKDGLMSLKY